MVAIGFIAMAKYWPPWLKIEPHPIFVVASKPDNKWLVCPASHSHSFCKVCVRFTPKLIPHAYGDSKPLGDPNARNAEGSLFFSEERVMEKGRLEYRSSAAVLNVTDTGFYYGTEFIPFIGSPIILPGNQRDRLLTKIREVVRPADSNRK
jgi:hypothetical protein